MLHTVNSNSFSFINGWCLISISGQSHCLEVEVGVCEESLLKLIVFKSVFMFPF